MWYPELEGDALAAAKMAIRKAKTNLMAESGLSENQVIVRDLVPTDFDITNEEYQLTVTSTAAWNTLFTEATVDDMSYLVIYGVGDATSTPLLSQLRITRSGEVKRLWNIQHVGQLANNLCFFDDPITIAQNTKVKMEGWNNTASTSSAYELVVIGACVQKEGLSITKDEFN